MGVYAHRFIEVIDKDNQWHLLPLWSKYKDSSYNQPDLVADDLKLTKHHCFLRRSSSGFYSPGSMYSVDDISHPIAQSELSDETREYIEHYDWPVRTECFLLSDIHGDQSNEDRNGCQGDDPGIILLVKPGTDRLACSPFASANDHGDKKRNEWQDAAKEGNSHGDTIELLQYIANLFSHDVHLLMISGQ